MYGQDQRLSEDKADAPKLRGLAELSIEFKRSLQRASQIRGLIWNRWPTFSSLRSEVHLLINTDQPGTTTSEASVLHNPQLWSTVPSNGIEHPNALTLQQLEPYKAFLFKTSKPASLLLCGAKPHGCSDERRTACAGPLAWSCTCRVSPNSLPFGMGCGNTPKPYAIDAIG